jgi:hypothetical protein
MLNWQTAAVAVAGIAAVVLILLFAPIEFAAVNLVQLGAFLTIVSGLVVQIAMAWRSQDANQASVKATLASMDVTHQKLDNVHEQLNGHTATMNALAHQAGVDEEKSRQNQPPLPPRPAV